MVTLRCTKKVSKFLGIPLSDTTTASTGALGDWYLNLIPVLSGAMFIFTNEKSLLTVALPIWE